MQTWRARLPRLAAMRFPGDRRLAFCRRLGRCANGFLASRKLPQALRIGAPVQRVARAGRGFEPAAIEYGQYATAVLDEAGTVQLRCSCRDAGGRRPKSSVGPARL